MNTPTSLEQALAFALQLALKERLQLIEQVASSIERDLALTTPRQAILELHWGKSLNQFVDEMGSIEMKYPEIDDPVAWLKHLRAERQQRLEDSQTQQGEDEGA